MNVKLSLFASRHHKNKLLRLLIKPLWNKYVRYNKNCSIRNLHQNGAEALHILHQAFSEAGITYWLEFGTLLGAIREHDFIPTDDDIDIGVFYSDCKKVQETLLKAGFRLKREIRVEDGTKGFEQTYMFRKIPIDIFFNHKTESDELFFHSFTFINDGKHPKNACIVEKITIPFTGVMEYPFKNKVLSVPTDYKAHLLAHYGPDYMIPDPTFDYTQVAKNIHYYPITERVGIYRQF